MYKKKSIFIFLITQALLLYSSYNPFATELPAQPSTLQLNYLTLFDAITKSSFEEETDKLVENLFITRFFMYYADRAAVQHFYRDGRLAQFNKIKAISTKEKNRLYSHLFLNIKGPYKTLVTQLKHVKKDLTEKISMLFLLPTAQPYVVSSIKEEVEAKITTLNNALQEKLAEKQQEIGFIQATIKGDEQGLNEKKQQQINQRKAQKEKLIKKIADLKEQLSFVERDINQKTEQKAAAEAEEQALKAAIEKIKTDMQGQSYTALEEISKKVQLLKNFKQYFDTHITQVANDYYQNYQEWQDSVSKESFFGRFKPLVETEPEEVANKAKAFQTKLKDAVTYFQEQLAKEGLVKQQTTTDENMLTQATTYIQKRLEEAGVISSTVKEGFLKLQAMAEGKKMLSKPEFEAIAKGIQASIDAYQKEIDSADFNSTKQTIQEKETLLENNATQKEQFLLSLNALQEKLANIKITVSAQEKELKEFELIFKDQQNKAQNELEQLYKKNESILASIEQDIKNLTQNSQEEKEKIYTTVDYQHKVREYVKQVEESILVKTATKLASIHIDLELLNMLPPVEKTITIDGLESTSIKTENLLEQAERIGRTFLYKATAWWEEQKKKSEKNSLPKKEKAELKKDIYFEQEGLIKILEAQKKDWQNTVQEIMQGYLQHTPQTDIISTYALVDAFDTINYPYLNAIGKLVNITFGQTKKDSLIPDEHTKLLTSFDLEQKESVATLLEAQEELIKSDTTNSIAALFFQEVAKQLKSRLLLIKIPLAETIDSGKAIEQYKQIAKVESIMQVIFKTQLHWYANTKELKDLWNNLLIEVRNKKNELLDAFATKIPPFTAKLVQDDFVNRNGTIQGKLPSMTLQIYAVQQLCLLVRLCNIKHTKNTKVFAWQQTAATIIKQVSAQLRLLQNDQTLFGQTARLLYERALEDLKKASIDPTWQTKEVETNPFF